MPSADDTLNAGGPAEDVLDQVCTCGHRRGDHHTIDEDCYEEGCTCEQFEGVNEYVLGGSADVLRAINDAHADKQREDLDRMMSTATRNNTREAADGVLPRKPTIIDLARVERETADRIRRQAQVDAIMGEGIAILEGHTLGEQLCECGHPFSDHTGICMLAVCECGEFKAMAVDMDPPADPNYYEGDPDPRAMPDPDKMHGAGDEFGGSDEGSHLHIPPKSVDMDKRRSYVPPLLTRRLWNTAELRKLLGDLPILEELPEVDRVTTNYDADHWRGIEAIVSFPQGSGDGSQANTEQQLKQIAACLLDLRQCVGVTLQRHEAINAALDKSAVTMRQTAEILDTLFHSLQAERTAKRGEA